MFSWLKPKTKEQKMEFRVNSLLIALNSESDFVFTELEKVQILNEVRRKFAEGLTIKRSEKLSKSTELQQDAKEIDCVLELLE